MYMSLAHADPEQNNDAQPLAQDEIQSKNNLKALLKIYMYVPRP